MPGTARVALGGMVFHVLNRRVGKSFLFCNDQDYLAFERIIADTLAMRPMRMLSYCLMPDHWHFVLWPEKDSDLRRFMRQLPVTQVPRWQKNYNLIGTGHVYQSRFKSFSVQTDEYFQIVNRYVERNALRANLLKRAVDLAYGSLWMREPGTTELRGLVSV